MNTRLLTPFALALLAAAAAGQTTIRQSLDAQGFQSAVDAQEIEVSGDGSTVAFSAFGQLGSTSTPAGISQIYVRNRVTGALELGSVSSGGVAADYYCMWPSLSTNGRYLAFMSRATNLTDDPHTSFPYWNVYVRDRATGETKLVSADLAGGSAAEHSFQPSISGDGRYVAFMSRASSLVQGDTNGMTDVFLRDTVAGTTVRVSVTDTGGQADGDSDRPRLSRDGRFLVYHSDSSNLVNGVGGSQIYGYDVALGVTEVVSLDTAGQLPSGVTGACDLSADGRYVAFLSGDAGFLPPAPLGTSVYVRDRVTGATSRESVTSGNLPVDAEPGFSSTQDFTGGGAKISADGRRVVFVSRDVLPGYPDTNGYFDVFVRDRIAGTLELVSATPSGTAGNDGSAVQVQELQNTGFPYHSELSISDTGRFIAFESLATDLVPGDSNQVSDVFLRELGCMLHLEAYGTGTPGTGGNVPTAGGIDGSCEGGYLIWVTDALAGAPGLMFVGVADPIGTPLSTGHVYLDLSFPYLVRPVVFGGLSGVPGTGSFFLTGLDLSSLGETTFALQFGVFDPGAPDGSGIAMSNGLSATLQ